jgi:hypothetical protein
MSSDLEIRCDISYLILSYLILSYLILSYLILSYLILSYLILSYLILYYLLTTSAFQRSGELQFSVLSHLCALVVVKPCCCRISDTLSIHRTLGLPLALGHECCLL